MFTGIIAATEKIVSVAPTRARGNVRVGIARPRGWDLKRGDSVNVNGVCSTVSGLTAKVFEVEYMPETLAITTAAALAKGAQVNLERSLRLNDRLDGHIVQGQVDTTGAVLGIKRATTPPS